MTDKIEVVVIDKPLLYGGITHPVDTVLQVPEDDADLLLTFKMVSASGERRKRSKKRQPKSPAKRNPARYPSTPPSGEHTRRDMQLEGDVK